MITATEFNYNWCKTWEDLGDRYRVTLISGNAPYDGEPKATHEEQWKWIDALMPHIVPAMRNLSRQPLPTQPTGYWMLHQASIRFEKEKDKTWFIMTNGLTD